MSDRATAPRTPCLKVDSRWGIASPETLTNPDSGTRTCARPLRNEPELNRDPAAGWQKPDTAQLRPQLRVLVVGATGFGHPDPRSG